MKKLKRIIPIIFVLTLLLSTYVFAHNSVFTKQTIAPKPHELMFVHINKS